MSANDGKVVDVVSTTAIRSRMRRHYTVEFNTKRTHLRRTVAARGAVLAGFLVSLVIYPMNGTLAPQASASNSADGVVFHEEVETYAFVLGQGPQLAQAQLAPPSANLTAQSLATSNTYIKSNYLPKCHGSPATNGRNGLLDASELCELWNPYFLLRGDAAVALAELNAVFKVKFGEDICLSSTYRTLGAQYSIRRTKGNLAAIPGRSNHGWGLAIDVCRQHSKGEYYDWLDANGSAFGWVNPQWAKTSKYEPWHWEFYDGVNDPNKGTNIALGEPDVAETLDDGHPDDSPFNPISSGTAGGTGTTDLTPTPGPSPGPN